MPKGHHQRKGYEMTEYKCMICGRVGSVGRCCSNELREPLNGEAILEQKQSLDSRMSYNDLNKIEKFVVDEYCSWRRSETCEIAYKMEQLNLLRIRARNLGIEHLL